MTDEGAPKSEYIEGILHKKGNAVFYTTWSLRFFELDVKRQKLKWYRCKPGGKKGVQRGEINLDKATASLKTVKQSSANQKGFLISLSYTPANSSVTAEMILLSSTLDEAYQWIAHTNIAGSYYEISSTGIIATICESGDNDHLLTAKQTIVTPFQDLSQCNITAGNIIFATGGVVIDEIKQLKPNEAIDQDTKHEDIGMSSQAYVHVSSITNGAVNLLKTLAHEVVGGIFDLFFLICPLLPLLCPVEYQLSVYIVTIYALLLWLNTF